MWSRAVLIQAIFNNFLSSFVFYQAARFLSHNRSPSCLWCTAMKGQPTKPVSIAAARACQPNGHWPIIILNLPSGHHLSTNPCTSASARRMGGPLVLLSQGSKVTLDRQSPAHQRTSSSTTLIRQQATISGKCIFQTLTFQLLSCSSKDHKCSLNCSL